MPASEAKAAAKARAAERRLDQAAQLADEKPKLRSPVDAWPSELVFFTRVTAMLR